MPELPEVETIRRQLAPHLEGRTLLGVEILDPRWTRPERPGAVERELRGRVVEAVGRSGKYLVWSLSGDRYLLVHLRMTGALLFDPDADPPHTRARFELDDGHRLIYVDPRRFGTGHVVRGGDARDAYLRERLGAEPLTPQFTTAYLQAAARGRRAPIKSFVLDQRRIAGVGNIYADEALFRARIHPLRAAGTLTRAQLDALREAIEDALADAIEAKGATIDDFRHVDGARGSFQDRFLVHRREGEPCPRCGATIRKLVVGGRGTYVCERCQPRPRPRRVATTTDDAGTRTRGAGSAAAKPGRRQAAQSQSLGGEQL
ncbi:MAG: bifunctional DNA-formamidopyrimidine glycosylase/DNA-(apurinic or apyrimidinic site) lyase [Solirubrobacteraceae bacterium]